MQRTRSAADRQCEWSLWGFLLAVTVARLWYVQHGFLELSPDEAHYWEWSRRLDWSYYSKGPFVAYVIAVSTALGGATELFVRLPAILLAAGTTFCVYRWLIALFGDARLALATAVLLHITPLFAAGALLMTIDAPLVFFWTLVLWLFYRAVTEERAVWWYGAGLLLGCGLLSKYAMGFLALSLFLFLVTSPQYRKWLWQKEPYIMLALGLVVFSPVIFWNLQHGAVSLKHVMEQAEVHQGLRWHLSLDTFGEFLGAQALALSPLLFVWMLVAMAMSLLIGLRRRDDRWLLLFWGWAPTFGIMLLLSLRQKVQANWAAPAYITALMALTAYSAQYWWGASASWPQRLRKASFGLAALLALGMTLAFHDPALFTHLGLSASDDPLARLKGWRTLGTAVGTAATQMSHPPFLLSNRYQISSELAFYTPGQPHTYNVNLGRRLNQYDLWGGLSALAGRDAIYVQPETPELPSALQASFQSCAAGEPVIIEEVGRELKRFYLFRCLGFSGRPPQPAQVRY
jgi:4-amino-4-deoxy-L-arabinose transferase-like glycosyltransferase